MNKVLCALLSLSLIIFSGCTVRATGAETSGTVMAYQVSEEESKELYLPEIEEKSESVSNEDINLIALVTMAEAEDECEEGKRLVIDTILNRMDSKEFPDTVSEVIFEPYQFPSMTNGRAERCEVRDDICELVREELQSRYNFDCIFFKTDYYSEYGTPLFRVGNHYFSSYV